MVNADTLPVFYYKPMQAVYGKRALVPLIVWPTVTGNP
jgi:hypothetical protein